MLPFLTDFDPLGGTSGSIDPLGALQAYGALADLLLPGMSTITTRSRYLAMLCRALRNADIRRSLPPGAAGLTERRKAVEPFERLWALACVAARDQGLDGAADGLRGISYAEKAYRNFSTRGRMTPDFTMLKYQGRTGGVGTYWTALVGGELVDPDTGRLLQEGVELAEAFPQPPLPDRDLSRLAQPDSAHRVALSADELDNWAEECHLAGAKECERNRIAEALTADDRRECIAQALMTLEGSEDLPDVWDVSGLLRLKSRLAGTCQAKHLGLPTVIQAVVVTEQFHEATLAVFQCLLWWGTMHATDPLEQLLSNEHFARALDRVRETARGLLEFRATCDHPEVRPAIESLAVFAQAIDRAGARRQILDETMQRHHRVQSGKLDGGAAKRDWVTLDSANRLLRPSPRYQRTDAPAHPAGNLLTHPYRLEQFVWMLRENGALTA